MSTDRPRQSARTVPGTERPGHGPTSRPAGNGDDAKAPAADSVAAMRLALDTLAQPPATRTEPFVSDLSVGELVLLDEVGYEPVDLVLGAGAASWNPQAATVAQGRDAWSWALTSACTTARAGIEEEVRARRADGVVAVHVEMDRRHGNLLQCTMVGTAVRRQRSAGHHGVPGAAPFTTTLSAGDFHLLTRAGHAPVAMVVGAAVASFPARSMAQGLGLSRENVELTDQTSALYAAREDAMRRIDAEARHVGADGIVSVTFSEHPVSTVLVHAVELLVLGTAVRRGERRPLQPHMQLSLDDPAPDVFQRG